MEAAHRIFSSGSPRGGSEERKIRARADAPPIGCPAGGLQEASQINERPCGQPAGPLLLLDIRNLTGLKRYNISCGRNRESLSGRDVDKTKALEYNI